MGSFTKQDIFYSIRNLIQKLYNSKDMVLTSIINSHITFNDLKLTSLEQMRIIMASEERFSVSIDESEINGNMSLGTIVNVIANHLKKDNRLIFSTYNPSKKHERSEENKENKETDDSEEIAFDQDLDTPDENDAEVAVDVEG